MRAASSFASAGVGFSIARAAFGSRNSIFAPRVSFRCSPSVLSDGGMLPPRSLRHRGGRSLERALAREPRSELRTRADAELAVDAAEVRLDRLRAEEERCPRLAVRRAACDDECDLELLRRQLLCCGGRPPSRLLSGGGEFGVDALLPGRRVEPLEGLERGMEALACLDPPARAAEPLREAELGAGALEGGRRALVPAEGLLELAAELLVGREKPPAASGRRERPCAPGRRRTLLEIGESPF